MNSLSWLLYAADLTANVSAIAGVSLFVVGAVGAFSWVPFMVGDKKVSDWTDWLRGSAVRAAVPVGLCVLVLVIAPSRNTIMLIAASEVGETVLASPQAQTIGGEAGELATDSLRVLRKFINDQLDVPASEETP